MSTAEKDYAGIAILVVSVFFATVFVSVGIIFCFDNPSVSAKEIPDAPEVPVTVITPLYDHLIATSPEWKKAYGDTLEARFVYNLAVFRSNQMEIAKMIAKLHSPVIDPNEVK